MSSDISVALISVFGGIALASASYWLTKKHEREADLRKQKLEHYKEFVLRLSGVISGESTPESQMAFATACNNLNLIAPHTVIEALQNFQQEIKISNQNKNQETHNILMSKLFYAMRKDLGVYPADQLEKFRVGLWASGSAKNPN